MSNFPRATRVALVALLLPCPMYSESFLEQRKVNSLSTGEAFARFAAAHGRDYQPGSTEWEERQQVFGEIQSRVEAHNRRPVRLWTATLTRFADRHPHERQAMLGYRREARVSTEVPGALGLEALDTVADLLPASVDYRHLPAMKDVQDQASCGSCWAFATVTALRGAYNKATGEDRTFSPQQLVSCTPNPRSCGGTGGCAGATVELAMKYIMHAGIQTTKEFQYEATDLPCPAALQMDAIPSQGAARAQFGLVGWSTLPANRAKPLMQALAAHGPVAISVAANFDWFMYGGGIVDTCDDSDPIVNHAVVLVGYGKDANVGFWTVQNSWGSSWGEDGFIRVLRFLDGHDADDHYCGWDTKPEEGIACKDDTADRVYVCGMCGILFDSVVPFFNVSGDKFM